MFAVDLVDAAGLARRLVPLGTRLDQLGPGARQVGARLGGGGRIVGVLQPCDHLAPAHLGAAIHRERGDAAGNLGGDGGVDAGDDVAVGGDGSGG